jgi:23S rRNA pseudouridine1911/1915/1917 synthase
MRKEKIRVISVSSSCQGMRLDQVISELFPDISRSQAQGLIGEKAVLLNGRQEKKRTVVHEGDTIQVEIPQERPTTLIPQDMEFSVLYEDDVLFVINKPPGMVVHPACGHWEGTFAHGFLAHCRSIESLDPLRPGIIHRLDKETSGVLIGAKTSESVRNLSQQFQKRLVQKWYQAILVGEMKREIDVDKAIGRDIKERKKMACLPSGRSAHSIFTPLRVQNGLTYAKIFIETGRTHQIRVHAAECGFPVLGDPVYGRKEMNKKLNVHRQMLHCSEIEIMHPLTACKMHFQAPLPIDMKSLLERFL